MSNSDYDGDTPVAFYNPDLIHYVSLVQSKQKACLLPSSAFHGCLMYRGRDYSATRLAREDG
eukprot:4015868-Amphidinium_carterae.1